MAIYIGDKELDTLYIGDKEIESVYRGDVEIWTNCTPYTVNPSVHAYDRIKTANGASVYANYGSNYVEAGYSDGVWSGGFCNFTASFKLPTQRCKKFNITVSRWAGGNSTSTLSVDGVSVGSWIWSSTAQSFTVDCAGKDAITVTLSGYNYIERDESSHQTAYLRIESMSFSK